MGVADVGGGDPSNEFFTIFLCTLAVVTSPMGLGARRQNFLFLLGLWLFDQAKHANHLTIDIEAEWTAPSNQPIHVVLHICRQAERAAVTQAIFIMSLICPHQFRCGA
ncbi:hypothetical protein OO17_29455 [Rhodopseudomonas palustris]|uniref:Uncharacterized protein n=1 Tax=Rhodopseudomonas palustris TaxID=1076 RepID=A0A0D7DVY2_RHOPL|nr:hypothetical protein OO17_29455 [Rhodopseudomonas palustris]